MHNIRKKKLLIQRHHQNGVCLLSVAFCSLLKDALQVYSSPLKSRLLAQPNTIKEKRKVGFHLTESYDRTKLNCILFVFLSELPFAPDGLDFEPITSFDKLSSELTFKTSDEKFLNTTTFEYGSPPTDPDTQHNSARSKAEDDFDFPLDVETGHHEEKVLPFQLKLIMQKRNLNLSLTLNSWKKPDSKYGTRRMKHLTMMEYQAHLMEKTLAQAQMMKYLC
ncbi:hypothetical protein J3Q64DRAFT_1395781 [Phycomyces blakesleeanus]|uniref:Uncharacterized protein n=1 Tax=Phycomyces blakesleeanus TaxID=4837 RepID=A0ABR3B475_PHYBL